jgi:hypothetical protein
MGVVNTTYTFSGTDTITSAKLNNIIDDTTFTSDAIQGTTLQVVSPGKLAVSASGITSNELASNSVVTAKILDSNVTTAKIADSNVTTAKIADSNVTTAKIADSNVTTAKIADANITQVKLASNVVGNGPAFRAFASTVTSLSNNVIAKVNLLSENFDTNSNFDSSRFTPTVAGYYQINCTVYSSAAPQYLQVKIYKNGSVHSGAVHTNVQTFASNVSDLVYCNGTTDYIEMYAVQQSGGTVSVTTGTDVTYMSGCLIRSA